MADDFSRARTITDEFGTAWEISTTLGGAHMHASNALHLGEGVEGHWFFGPVEARFRPRRSSDDLWTTDRLHRASPEELHQLLAEAQPCPRDPLLAELMEAERERRQTELRTQVAQRLQRVCGQWPADRFEALVTSVVAVAVKFDAQHEPHLQRRPGWRKPAS